MALRLLLLLGGKSALPSAVAVKCHVAALCGPLIKFGR
jgi:hypothetical protein